MRCQHEGSKGRSFWVFCKLYMDSHWCRGVKTHQPGKAGWKSSCFFCWKNTFATNFLNQTCNRTLESNYKSPRVAGVAKSKWMKTSSQVSKRMWKCKRCFKGQYQRNMLEYVGFKLQRDILQFSLVQQVDNLPSDMLQVKFNATRNHDRPVNQKSMLTKALLHIQKKRDGPPSTRNKLTTSFCIRYVSNVNKTFACHEPWNTDWFVTGSLIHGLWMK